MVKRRGGIENGNGNGHVRAKKPRMKWTDELHQSFLDAVATLGGEDHATPKTISCIMRSKDVTTLNIKSHLQNYRNLRQRHLIQGVLECADDYEKKQIVDKINEELDLPAPQQRQPRLRRIKELIAGNALENHHFHHHHLPVLESSNNVVTVHMPGEEDQRPYAYLIFGDLVNPSTTQAEHKGKEKTPIEDYHPTTKQFYEKLVKKSHYKWASSLKLGIQ